VAAVPKKKGDLLAQLLARDESGARLSGQLIMDNIKTFLFAGHDTTGATAGWALSHLARNPGVQRALRAEVDALFDGGVAGAAGGAPGYAQLRQLRMLDAVLKETLRLDPPAGFTRAPTEDTVIGAGTPREQLLPAGTEVFIFPWLVHRHPAYWERPDEFDPSRFLNVGGGGGGGEGGAAAEAQGPYMPFSMGVRNCVGAQLAQAELRTIVAHVVRRYELVPCAGAPTPRAVLLMTLNPSPVWLTLRVRKHESAAAARGGGGFGEVKGDKKCD
jgi:cytochrome P450